MDLLRGWMNGWDWDMVCLLTTNDSIYHLYTHDISVRISWNGHRVLSNFVDSPPVGHLVRAPHTQHLYKITSTNTPKLPMFTYHYLSACPRVYLCKPVLILKYLHCSMLSTYTWLYTLTGPADRQTVPKVSTLLDHPFHWLAASYEACLKLLKSSAIFHLSRLLSVSTQEPAVSAVQCWNRHILSVKMMNGHSTMLSVCIGF